MSIIISNSRAMFNSKEILIEGNEDWAAFQELIQRGANLWPDAPPEIKEFADLVTNGRVLQDYYAQNKDQRKIHHTPEQLEGVAK